MGRGYVASKAISFRMPSVLFSVKAMATSPWIFPMGSRGEEGIVSGGVLHHGTHEEDGPVTREALAFPREVPVLRRAGDPSPKPVRLQEHERVTDLVGRTSACPRR